MAKLFDSAVSDWPAGGLIGLSVSGVRLFLASYFVSKPSPTRRTNPLDISSVKVFRTELIGMFKVRCISEAAMGRPCSLRSRLIPRRRESALVRRRLLVFPCFFWPLVEVRGVPRLVEETMAASAAAAARSSADVRSRCSF